MLHNGIYQMSFKVDLILDVDWSKLGIKLGWVSPPVEKFKITREPAVGRGWGWGDGPFLQGTTESLSS